MSPLDPDVMVEEDFDDVREEEEDKPVAIEDKEQVFKLLNQFEKISVDDKAHKYSKTSGRFDGSAYLNYNYHRIVSTLQISSSPKCLDIVRYLLSTKEYKLIQYSGYQEESIFYFLNEPSGIMIYVGYGTLNAFFPTDIDYAKISELQTKLKTFCGEKTSGKVYVILKDQELYLAPFAVKRSNSPILLNYNKDFEPIHNKVLSHLSQQDSKGIVLLHGEPGSGKTHYIKYLTSLAPNKKFIFMPSHMSSELTSVGFINFLTRHKNSVFIIEDAENAIRKREDGDRNSAVSNILNIADGLLSDLLKVQIICTFNCKVADIDDAILRSGRLISEYEFKKLEKGRAQELADYLGKDLKISKDTILADIYNADNIQGKKDKADSDPIGFKKYII